MGYESPFEDNSIFSPVFDQQQEYNKYLTYIYSLMQKKGINEFYYAHTSKGTKYGAVFHGYIKHNKLNVLIVPSNYKLTPNEQWIYEVLLSETSWPVKVYSGGNLLIKGNSSSWKWMSTGYHFSSLPFDEAYYKDKHTFVSTSELKQIYEEMLFKKNELPLDDFANKIPELSKTIQKQLENPFYKDVQVCVYIKQIDSTGRLVGENSLKTSYKKGKECEVVINITLKPNNQIKIEQRLSDKYLNEYVEKWEQEARERGLDIDVEELRKEIIEDFGSAETEHDFFEEFIQSIDAFFNDKIGGYIEAIQATQKVVKHVWAEGTIDESMWLTKHYQHKEWPEYMRINSYIGGVVDGAIDEITGIPLAIRGIYDLATDEEKRAALLNMFSKDGVKKMVEGLVKEGKEILNDNDRSQHFVGKSIIGVISTITGFSLFSKGGKISDTLDATTDRLKNFVSPKVVKLYDDVRSYFLKKPKQGGIEVNDYLKKLDDGGRNDLGEELVENADEFTRLKVEPQKFIDGKKYEDAIKKIINEGNPEYLEKVAQQAGISVKELGTYTPLHQVQIRIPGTQGGFTTMDNVWIKKMKDPVTGKEYLEAIVNECKLSKDSPFTKRQLEFEKALDDSKSYFDLRNTKYQRVDNASDRILQNTEIRVKTYIKTVGEGGSSPNFSKFSIEKIK